MFGIAIGCFLDVKMVIFAELVLKKITGPTNVLIFDFDAFSSGKSVSNNKIHISFDWPVLVQWVNHLPWRVIELYFSAYNAFKKGFR